MLTGGVMKAKGFTVRNHKPKARDLKLSIQKAKRDHKGMKVLDAGILSKAGKILGVKVA
jgi:hypothetical protein